jgi:ABC-type uncharacterized transport system permease subunit
MRLEVRENISMVRLVTSLFICELACVRPLEGSHVHGMACIRMATPLIFGTLGELVCERTGVVRLLFSNPCRVRR